MNAREARKIISGPDIRSLDPEQAREALRLSAIALRHEEVMERVADLEAQEEAKLTLEDLLHIKVQTETLERLLHHLPDSIVDHIGFICDAEMKDRYARREKIEKECEA